MYKFRHQGRKFCAGGYTEKRVGRIVGRVTVQKEEGRKTEGGDFTPYWVGGWVGEIGRRAGEVRRRGGEVGRRAGRRWVAGRKKQ